METFSGTRLAVNTQTPLLRFVEGVPVPTTGGVVRMIVPLLARWRREGHIEEAEWVAMGVGDDDRRIEHDGLHLSFVGVPQDEKAGYALVKEHMWALLNSNPGAVEPHVDRERITGDASAYHAYQRRSANALLDASDRLGGADLLYIHDFQQLGVASAWEGAPVPKVFQLHTPFPSVLPPGWADFFIAHLERYDAVIVSTRRYARNLEDAGLQAPVHVIHPFIDPETYASPSPRDTRRFRERVGISDDDRVILNVARMDPMKGQDRLLDAMPDILAREPRARLVLVGNGSFSSSKRGGLGIEKGKAWRLRLEAQAARLGIAQRVTFTGHLADEELPSAYDACEVFALPSVREGFGLAVIEAWQHQKPVVVSDRTGVCELVEDGVNGFCVDAAVKGRLADAILRMLMAPDAARAMGQEGKRASRAATLDVGRLALESVFRGALEERTLALA